MSDRNSKHDKAEARNRGHETRDANVVGVLLGGAAFLAALAVILPALVWLFDSLMAGARRAEPPISPLAVSEQPPPPRLQTDPHHDLVKLRRSEDEMLDSYGWIDRGVVRIPIRRAMDVVLERGLPKPAAPRSNRPRAGEPQTNPAAGSSQRDGLPRQMPSQQEMRSLPPARNAPPNFSNSAAGAAVNQPAAAELRLVSSADPNGALPDAVKQPDDLLPARQPSAKMQPLAALTQGVELQQRLGEQVPLDLEFRDETGQRVRLSDYFGRQPVVLALVYFRCPMLCTEVLNGLLKSSQGVPLTIGRDYQVLTVSIDARETPKLAAEKKSHYVRQYRRSGAAEGWHFLTGDQPSIDRLTRAVGFQYRYDPVSDQFAHASGIVVLTPHGRLSRYFYGIEYPPSHLRWGLIESADDRIGSPVDQILLLCFHYDPATGKYGLVLWRVLLVACTATVVFLGSFLLVMFRRERRLAREVRAAVPAAAEARETTS